MTRPEHDPTAYGRRMAGDYDDFYGFTDTEIAVERLAELAGEGPVLELGVGTGRLSIPLAERGLAVHGLDASWEMLEGLRARPGGERIVPVHGDFTDARLNERFSLVVLAVNTIFALPSPEAQIECFRTAAHHLRPDGAFVVEAYVLDPLAFRDGLALWPRHSGGGRVLLELAEHDGVDPHVRRTIVGIGGGLDVVEVHDTYAAPRELDLMARMAGLALGERWRDWAKRRFGTDSRGHVSIYRSA
jgi:SAM-dependent methyltransferase